MWTSVHSYPVRTKPGPLPSRDILAERPEATGGWHKLPQCLSRRGGGWRLYPHPSSPPAAWLPPSGRPCLQPAGGAWGQKHKIGWDACDHLLKGPKQDPSRRGTNWELKEGEINLVNFSQPQKPWEFSSSPLMFEVFYICCTSCKDSARQVNVGFLINKQWTKLENCLDAN